VAIVVERDTGKLLSGPELSSKGVTFQEVAPELMAEAREAVLQTIGELGPVEAQDWERIADQLRLSARRRINQILGRKPQVQTILLWA
jgi:ribonuclease J